MNRLVFIFSIFAMLVGVAANADTYTCEDKSGELRATATPNGKTAVLVLSNPKISQGKQTIAVFKEAVVDDKDENLLITGSVDFRSSEMRRGEYIAGTRLGRVKTISLLIEQEDGKYTGEISLEKRNGNIVDVDVTCTKK